MWILHCSLKCCRAQSLLHYSQCGSWWVMASCLAQLLHWRLYGCRAAVHQLYDCHLFLVVVSVQKLSPVVVVMYSTYIIVYRQCPPNYYRIGRRMKGVTCSCLSCK